MWGSRALLVFLILSLVSLFADMCYEGARSIAGAYMGVLSAPVIATGLLGIGEFLSYSLRAFTGLLLSRRASVRNVWLLIILGYIINLGVVPALALTGRWEQAFFLLLGERIGKGLRTPARDVVLSDVTAQIGRGKAFGFHELMDQIGAVAGPLFVATSIGKHGFKYSFIRLGIPAAIAVGLVFIAAVIHHRIRSGMKTEWRGFPRNRSFIFFLAAVFFINAGFIHWFLAGYHLIGAGIGASDIAFLYTVAMTVDALAAFPLGYIYDKTGVSVLFLSPAIVVLSSLLILHDTSWDLLIIASGLWGLFMCFLEVVYKAAVSDLSGGKLAGGFGYYYAIQAAGWGVGSVLMAAMYTYSPGLLLYYILTAELIGLVLIIYLSIRHNE